MFCSLIYSYTKLQTLWVFLDRWGGCSLLIQAWNPLTKLDIRYLLYPLAITLVFTVFGTVICTFQLAWCVYLQIQLCVLPWYFLYITNYYGVLWQVGFVQALHDGSPYMNEFSTFCRSKVVFLFPVNQVEYGSTPFYMLFRMYQVRGGSYISLVIQVFSFLGLVIPLEDKQALTVLGQSLGFCWLLCVCLSAYKLPSLPVEVNTEQSRLCEGQQPSFFYFKTFFGRVLVEFNVSPMYLYVVMLQRLCAFLLKWFEMVVVCLVS